MSKAKSSWVVALGVALGVAWSGIAPVAAADPSGASMGKQLTLPAPREVNVRELATHAPKAGSPVLQRRPLPALPIPDGWSPLSTPTDAPSDPTWVGSRPRASQAGAPFGELTAFAGMTFGTANTTAEPPDPWIAVGPTDVVQAVNTSLRFSTRSGAKNAEVSLAAFFLEPVTEEFDSDPRVLYDASHARWVAIELSADCAVGHLRLAVSATSDATGSWLVWDFAFSGSLPDYPGLGLTADKIVFTANHFAGTCTSGAFTGSAVYAIDWAEVIGGGSVSYTYWPSVSTFAWRAAANLTSDADAHLVAMGPSGQVVYGEITGTNAGADLSMSTNDLTTAGVVPPFATPPVPVDPLGPISSAVDARPTDALWQAGHLWFVSTYPHSFDLGATYRDTVRITELDTTGSVALVQDVLLGDVGYDAYMGGIGLSQAGGLYAVYTESNSSTYTSIVAAYQGSTTPANQFDGFRQLVAGQAGYKGSRWGDYVGVATDPVDPNAVWQADEYANAIGWWSTRVSMLRQFLAPTAPTAVAAVAGIGLAQVAWTAPGDNGGSAITGYTVTSAPDAKTCTWTTGPLSCSVTGLTAGTPYTFTVTATNVAGTGPASDPSAPVTPYSGATYVPVTPVRLLDTRSGNGLAGAFTAGHHRTFQVTGRGGPSNVPADAVAVTGNLTVTRQTSGGYVALGPDATDTPSTSTINFPTGENRPNGVTVQLGAGGTLSAVYIAGTGATTALLFDVTGYFVPDAT
jgi:hypothetical protein